MLNIGIRHKYDMYYLSFNLSNTFCQAKAVTTFLSSAVIFMLTWIYL